MAINYDALMACSVNDEACRYTDADAMLYALATGFGQDPDQPRELDYVYDGRDLKSVPTMAGNLFSNGFLADTGLDERRLVHAEQRLQLYRPLPTAAELRMDRRVVAVLDHGKESGASILVESEARMAKDDTVLFTLGTTLLARGDGGFGGPTGNVPLPHKIPEREPDLVCGLASRLDQALLFRLTGDRNPRFADPDVARAQGYDTAPLQEQCLAGISCRAILNTICEYDFTLISGFDLRYVAPLYPGETLETEMWQERNIVSFRGVSRNRGVVVIDNGRCTLAA